MSASVTVRRFALRDLSAAERFCEAARALDPAIEPFAQSLARIASGPRAALHLWSVAAADDGAVYGVAFAAVREQGSACDFYAAVHPSLRRQGFGRALAQEALAERTALRARVRDDAFPGIAYLRALGFAQSGAHLSLQWSGKPLPQPRPPAVRVRDAGRADHGALRALSNEAWAGAPDAIESRADEVAQLLAGDGRLVLLAEWEGKPAGYLSAVRLGRAIGIEEVAVLAELRRKGIGRALLTRAISGAEGALLSVAESNTAARAFYRSLAFRQVARRLVMERRPH